jgi:hypothetical protein
LHDKEEMAGSITAVNPSGEKRQISENSTLSNPCLLHNASRGYGSTAGSGARAGALTGGGSPTTQATILQLSAKMRRRLVLTKVPQDGARPTLRLHVD